MILIQSFLVAIEMLRMHKLRAFLTMLGVIIGVMSVTLIVMISNGFQGFLNNEFKKMGADTIMVFYDPGGRGRGQSLSGTVGLRNDDIDYLLAHSPLLDIGSGFQQLPPQSMKVGDLEMKDPKMWAIDQNFLELNRFTLTAGRAIDINDLKARANVCVIGVEVRDRLFPNGQAIGKFIFFRDIALQVIGVLEKSEIFGESNGRTVLVPITTAQDKWVGGKDLSIITLRPKPGVAVKDAMKDIWEVLMAKSGNRPIYRVDSRESILGVFNGIIGAAGAILAAIAALSLLVGGIGIMNIMLVSVTERTREIGLRMSVGAKRNALLIQFLVESATLSLVGGLIGMGIARGLGLIATAITAQRAWPTKSGLDLTFPLPAALMAMAFSALIGIVFGLFPAASAARLDPIVALRRE